MPRVSNFFGASVCLWLASTASHSLAQQSSGEGPAAASVSPDVEAERSARTEDPANLAELGAMIGSIGITIDNVFDTSNPEEDKRLYRWANRLHRRTRPHVVRNILLFEEGEPLDARVLAETERLLRTQRFVAQATVLAQNYDPATNMADVDVHIRDAWSLEPDLKASRGGGANEYGIGITDDNLFGLGKSMTLSYESTIDRDQRMFGFTDPNLRGSRVRMNIDMADMSDGRRIGFGMGRPFFELDSRWSLTGSTLDDERVEPIYDLGEIVDEFRHDTKFASVEGGFSKGLINGIATRWIAGLTYEEDLFQNAAGHAPAVLLPADRKLVYPWLGVHLIEDDFRQVTELNDIGRTEDIALGLNLLARIGRTSTGLGSDRDATIFEFSASRGWEPGGPGRLFLFRSTATARQESVGVRNSIVTLAGQYYRRNFENGLLSVSINTVLGNKLDFENQVLLGGDSDLRGYPLRYQSGDRSAILTLEQRFFTDWYPFRLIRVGYAFFIDAGRVWGEDPRSDSDLGTLYDLGVGLRLTSPRSSSRSMVHVDLAFPVNAPADIDSVQLNIERKTSF